MGFRQLLFNLIYLFSSIFQQIESADDSLDVDIEGGDDKNCARKLMSSGTVQELDVEEFFVKYKN